MHFPNYMFRTLRRFNLILSENVPQISTVRTSYCLTCVLMSRSKDIVILCLFYTCVKSKNKKMLILNLLLLLHKYLFQLVIFFFLVTFRNVPLISMHPKSLLPKQKFSINGEEVQEICKTLESIIE
jgi:hypothetical protein